MIKRFEAIEASLVFLMRDNQILLANKVRKIGKGYLNGYGGKLEKGETPESNASREVFTEAQTIVLEKDLEKVAIAYFWNVREEQEDLLVRVHVFVSKKWYRDPVSTEEMSDPEWHEISSLNELPLMLADYQWLPVALSGKKIYAEAWYGPEQKTLLRDVRITEVEKFEE